jgi:hypothetical protein
VSWAGWLLGGKPRLRHHGHLAGTGEYATHVAGADDYGAAFEQVVGGRTHHSAYHECTAFLVPDPNQPFDPDAVAVVVSGCTVGYLGPEEARQYREFLNDAELGTAGSCDALIEGGWQRGNARGAFLIRLDLEWPLRLEE